jgi:prepilin peptidase CpaA
MSFAFVLEGALLIAVPGLLALAAVLDLLTFRIPNKLTLGLAGAFLLVAPFSGLGATGFGMHVAAGGLTLLVGMLLFAPGWIGGGDAKLLAAVSLWFGFEHLLEFTLLAAVLGGALGLAVLMYRRSPVPAFPSQEWAVRLHDRKAGIPYGVALAGAALLIYPETAWLSVLAG